MMAEDFGCAIAASIDWTVCSEYPLDLIHCHCGAYYRSHAKVENVDGRMRPVTERGCPGCASHLRAKRIESPPESMTLRRPHA